MQLFGCCRAFFLINDAPGCPYKIEFQQFVMTKAILYKIVVTSGGWLGFSHGHNYPINEIYIPSIKAYINEEYGIFRAGPKRTGLRVNKDEKKEIEINDDFVKEIDRTLKKKEIYDSAKNVLDYTIAYIFYPYDKQDLIMKLNKGITKVLQDLNPSISGPKINLISEKVFERFLEVLRQPDSNGDLPSPISLVTQFVIQELFANPVAVSAKIIDGITDVLEDYWECFNPCDDEDEDESEDEDENERNDHDL